MEIRSLTISYTKHKGKRCRNQITELENHLKALEIIINNCNNVELINAEIEGYDNLKVDFNESTKPKEKVQFCDLKSGGLNKVKNLRSIFLIWKRQI